MAGKKQAKVTLNHSYTCQNPSCSKVFSKPIKASNLSLEKVEAYDACPHCLTKIVGEEISSIDERKADLKVEDVQNEDKLGQALPTIEKEIVERPPKIQCTHHFGYLSQRPKKEGIPEECMVCERIVKCMLKNVSV